MQLGGTYVTPLVDDDDRRDARGEVLWQASGAVGETVVVAVELQEVAR